MRNLDINLLAITIRKQIALCFISLSHKEIKACVTCTVNPPPNCMGKHFCLCLIGENCNMIWLPLWLSGRRRQWHPTPVLLPGKSHGRRSLVGCNPWGRQESDTTEQLQFHNNSAYALSIFSTLYTDRKTEVLKG